MSCCCCTTVGLWLLGPRMIGWLPRCSVRATTPVLPCSIPATTHWPWCRSGLTVGPHRTIGSTTWGKPRIVSQQYLASAAEVMMRLAETPAGESVRSQH